MKFAQVLSTLAIPCIWAAPIAAQDALVPLTPDEATPAPGSQIAELPEIVVWGQEPRSFGSDTSSSGTNVSASLIETPATVNVFAEDFLDTIATRSLEDLIQYVPGAGVENAGDPFSPKFNLRGFTVDSLQSGGIYEDGYQAVRRGYHFDRSLYERVDVLKGTSAVKYGLATPGGVVNYMTKKPQFDPAYRVEGEIGSFDTRRSSLDLTGPLNKSGTVAYRLLATTHESNQTVNGESNDRSFDNRFIVKPSLMWQTPSGGHVLASYEFSDVESVFDPGVKRLDDGRFLFNTGPYVGPESGFDREIHKGTIEFVQPLGENWQVLLGGAMIRNDNVSRIDAAFFGNLDGNPMPRWTAKSIEDYEQNEVRAEISGKFDTGEHIHHQLTLGVSYLDSEVSVDRAAVTTSGAIDPFNPRFGPAPALPDPTFSFNIGTNSERSVYLQDYVSINELKVFGGVRYTDFEIFRDHVTASDYRNSDSAVDWNIGAIYNHSDLINPFASYSTSTEPQREVPEPRDGEQIEFGLKSSWFGGRLITTASVFEIEQTNIAEESPPNSGQFILVGNQRTRGFEFEAVGMVTEQIRIIGGYSYLDAEFTESTTGNKGNTPHSVPRNKVSLFGEYAFPGSLKGLTAGLGFIHVGDREGSNANTFGLPSYERVDFGVGYERGPFNIRLTIENVLDEDYIAGSGGNGHTLAQGAPRFFTLAAGWQF